ncbi:MAG TPA: NGG1p interacting factor NIF3 [Marinagarivorans sp.]
MLKLSVYVPATDIDSVKQALFDAGAGRIGNYDCCAWQTRGTGQFRPLAGSQPTLGQHGAIERVEEYLVEMVLTQAVLKPVLAALKRAHPYEEPAFGVYSMMDVSGVLAEAE